jgi:hypothetical protein
MHWTGVLIAGLALSVAGAAAVLGWPSPRADDPAEPVAVAVAGERLNIPAGFFRFDDQRAAGQSLRIDLAMAWPTLGPVAPKAGDDPDPTVVYVSIEPRENDLDSSARLGTVYRRFFVGPALAGPDGLVGTRLAKGSGYEDEIMFYEPGRQRPFVTRCFATGTENVATVCTRETLLGKGLVAVWRYRWPLIAAWKDLDARIAARLDGFRPAP